MGQPLRATFSGGDVWDLNCTHFLFPILYASFSANHALVKEKGFGNPMPPLSLFFFRRSECPSQLMRSLTSSLSGPVKQRKGHLCRDWGILKKFFFSSSPTSQTNPQGYVPITWLLVLYTFRGNQIPINNNNIFVPLFSVLNF